MATSKYSLSFPPFTEATVGKDSLLSSPWQRWFVELMDRFLYRWEDLRFPAQGINPPGGVGSATIDAATGLLSFAGNTDNAIAGAAQLPHGWLRGSTVRPHIHLRFPTSAAANTRWLFQYDVASVNDDWANASGTYTTLSTITVANPANVNRHVIAGFGDLAMSAYRESCIMLWKITRLANSDALDDDTNACLLAEFDLHYQVGKFGTVSEYPPV